MLRALIACSLIPALSGCVVASVADAAIDVATLPVKAVSKGVDLATTSQAEADQKRGREIRKAEEKAGREAREACKAAKARGEPCQPAPRAE